MSALADISSPAVKVKYCPWIPFDADALSFSVYPGEQFFITVVALGQTDFPVSAKLLSEHKYTSDKYCLSPTNHYINAACTEVSFRLYSAVDGDYVHLKLYQENLCQSLISG